MWSGDTLHSSSASVPLLTTFCFTMPEDTGPVSTASRAWPLIVEGGSMKGVGARLCFHCRKGRSMAKKDKEKSRRWRLSGVGALEGVGAAACRRTSHTLGRPGARTRGLRQAGISCWRQSKQSPSPAQGSDLPCLAVPYHWLPFAFSWLCICRHTSTSWHSEEA